MNYDDKTQFQGFLLLKHPLSWIGICNESLHNTNNDITSFS